MHLGNQGVANIDGAKHATRGPVTVPFVDVFDVHYGEDVVSEVPEGYPAVELYLVVNVDGQGDWYREERAVRQTHVIDDRPVVLSVHETIQGREGPGRHELEVAGRSFGDLYRREPRRLVAKLFDLFADCNQVH